MQLVCVDTANDELQAAIELSLQESQQAEAEERELHRYPTFPETLQKKAGTLTEKHVL